MDSSIQPFTVKVPDSKLESTKVKLGLAEFPEQTPLSDSWDYGVPVSDVRRLVEHWKNGFDWRAQEAKLNELPQYMTRINVDGFGDLGIHFVYKRSGRPDSVPLLFCHGCKSTLADSLPTSFADGCLGPGSFLEVTKILPLLTEPNDGPAYDVVAPSLPNFGFSEGPSKPGFGAEQYAECMHKLMLKLGYNKYGMTFVPSQLGASSPS